MALIFFLSSIEYPDRVGLPENADKVIHFFEYAVLSALFLLSFRKSGFIKNVFLLSVLLAGCYGMTDEYHQLFVAGRHASISDVFADFAGAFLGGYLANKHIKKTGSPVV